MPDDDLTEDVNDLIEQLKENNNNVKKAQKHEEFELKPEDLEKFILNRTGQLINQSMDMIDTVKSYVESAPEADDVGSLAELLRATTSSIDTLSKILVQDKRGTTSTKLKQMDIESKRELQDNEQNNKIALTRQEVLSHLIQNSDVIELEDGEKEENQPKTD